MTQRLDEFELPIEAITEAQWRRILGGRGFRVLVNAEQEAWAGKRAVSCKNCDRASDAGGDPWRGYCLVNRCMVGSIAKLCPNFAVAGSLQAARRAIPIVEISAPQASPAPAMAQAAANSGVRDTSMAAYRAAQWNGKLTRQQARITDFFLANPQRTFTRQELASALNLGINVICGRVNELMHAPLEFLVEVEKRECRVTGEKVNALELQRTDFMRRAA